MAAGGCSMSSHISNVVPARQQLIWNFRENLHQPSFNPYSHDERDSSDSVTKLEIIGLAAWVASHIADLWFCKHVVGSIYQNVSSFQDNNMTANDRWTVELADFDTTTAAWWTVPETTLSSRASSGCRHTRFYVHHRTGAESQCSVNFVWFLAVASHVPATKQPTVLYGKAWFLYSSPKIRMSRNPTVLATLKGISRSWAVATNCLGTSVKNSCRHSLRCAVRSTINRRDIAPTVASIICGGFCGDVSSRYFSRAISGDSAVIRSRSGWDSSEMTLFSCMSHFWPASSNWDLQSLVITSVKLATHVSTIYWHFIGPVLHVCRSWWRIKFELCIMS